MRVLREPRDAAARAHLVLLPGAFTTPEDLQREGFASCVSSLDAALAVSLVELDLQHVGDRSFIDRLQREVIEPLRTQSGAPVWLAGISLGAFFALRCAERYGQELAGLALIAPYLGNRMVTSEIEQAGGVDRWEPLSLAADDDERQVWRFIQTLRHGPLPIYLGLGSEDRFAAGQRLLAEALPADRVEILPGGHDFSVWLPLWRNFLTRHFSHNRAHD